MMNLFTRIGWQTRAGLYHNNLDKGALGKSAEELVDYMLFVDEAPLANTIRGTSGFSEKFSSEGPHDNKGRSLRQLDLERRLMRYPCSYMIYSDAFDALPSEAKDAIYRRMWLIPVGSSYGREVWASLVRRPAGRGRNPPRNQVGFAGLLPGSHAIRSDGLESSCRSSFVLQFENGRLNGKR